MKIKTSYRVYCRRLPLAVEITFDKKAKEYIANNVKELREYEILQNVVEWYLEDELEEIVLLNHKPMIQLKDFTLHMGVFKQ